MPCRPLEILIQHRGMICALISGLCYAFAGLSVTLSVQTVSPIVVSFVFFLCHVIGLPFINWGLDPIYSSKITVMILLSALLDVILTLASFYSYHFIEFGNANALLYSKTIFCGVLAWLFLGERFTRIDFVLLSIHFVGVIFVTKPSFIFEHGHGGYQISNFLGCVLALSGSLASCLEFITVRYLVEKEAFDAALLFVIKCLIGIVLAGILSYFNLSTHQYIRTLRELGFVIFTCISGFVAYALNIIALRTEDAKTVAAIVSVEVIVAFFLQVSFTDQRTDLPSLTGATLITVALILFCVEGIYYQRKLEAELIIQRENIVYDK